MLTSQATRPISWFCWVFFIEKYSLRAQLQTVVGFEDEDHHEEQDEERETGKDFKGAMTITIKSSAKLLPMDTFTGKADPYVKVTVDGVTQKTATKSATLVSV
jgi:hypothetical protein